MKKQKITTKQLCVICKEKEHRYKCPICLSPYCSVGCYKKHKEQPCTKTQVEKKEPIQRDDGPEILTKIRLEEDEEKKYQLNQSHFDLIENLSEKDEEIKKIVSDRRLQKLIINIASKKDPISAYISISQSNPDFAEFADQLLRCIHVRDNAGHSLISPGK